MAPVRNITNKDCVILMDQLQTTESFNITNSTNANTELGESELQALLYIVVTLLFYSLGIIIGIVTYLKREKQEMEEDKVYDEFLSMQHDTSTNNRFKKVQQVIKTLEFLQSRQLIKSERKNKIINEDIKGHAQTDNENKMASNPKSLTFMFDKEDRNNSDDEDIDEPLSVLVAKLIDPEKHKTCDYDYNEGLPIHKTLSEETSNPCESKKNSELQESSSMQSLKDYAEEPRRNERSSLSSEDDVTDSRDDVQKNVNNGDKTGKSDNFDAKSVNSGSCVVTNV